MRTVKLDREVTDVNGYFFELVKAGFEVLSISIYEKRTFVNLEDEEDKDPLPFAETFIGAESRTISRSAMEERREIYHKYLEEKPFRMENLRARYRVSQEVQAMARGERPSQESAAGVAPTLLLEEQRPEVLALPPASKESWVKKLFKLW